MVGVSFFLFRSPLQRSLSADKGPAFREPFPGYPLTSFLAAACPMHSHFTCRRAELAGQGVQVCLLSVVLPLINK